VDCLRRVGFLFVVLLSWSTNLCSEPVTVLVLDPDLDLPLQGATVQADSVIGKTDAAGRVTLNLPDGKSILLVVTYPGYATNRTSIPPQTSSVAVNLRLANVVSGPVLVVEKAKPDQTNAQPGVSQVVSKESIKNTSEVGVFEDLTASLRLLPGVGYGGNFDAQLSVRGGDPSETAAYLDSAPLLFPYHWTGVVSIFDPNFLDSAKLSDGVISARYGEVLSGLIEVTSKSPLTEQPRLTLGLSTTGFDSYLQYPISQRFGILAGGKITWMEVPFALYGASRDFNQVPYIRDGYARAEWKPVDNLDWSTNFFYGSDGLDQKNNNLINLNLSSYPQESYQARNWEVSSSLRWLWTEHQFFKVVASVNDYSETLNASDPTGGFENVNIDAQEYALSAEWDIELGGANLLIFGANDSFQSVLNNFHIFYEANNVDAPIVPPRNYANTWSGYALDQFSFLSRHLEGELGLRLDGVNIFGDGFNLPTLPSLNPRVRLQFNPVTDSGSLRGLEFHAGSGLYSQIPLKAFYFSSNSADGVVAQTMKPERSWITELGSSLSLDDGWRISVDGYYKAYWDRLYEFFYTDFYSDPGTGIVTLHMYNDGIGYATGAEVMLQKLKGRFWDGWLDYTFNLTRYLNPSTGGLDPRNMGSFFPSDAPIGMWYYPIYQRLHTVNLVFNWKPLSWLTVTTTGTFATGTPPYQDNATSTYSDSARTPDVYVLNLKVTLHDYFHDTKVGWEFYVAVQNLLVNLLNSGTVANETGDQANFNLGYPVPSFGFKLSY
jgi:outer membrane receptor for ferrienterochelin and colicin